MDIIKWKKDIDQITHTFTKEFGHLSEEQLNWKPDAGTWSIAQNIDHLITINSTYFPLIENVRKNNYTLPWFGKYNFISRFFGSIILNSVNPDRRKKMKTFSIWEPSQSNIKKDILQRFEKHQNVLKEFITNSKDLILKETVISSPANRNIIYKLSTAFDIIVAHEKRHLNQAKEVLMQQEIKSGQDPEEMIT